MKKYLVVAGIILFFTYHAYADDVYFFASYLSPDGRSDIFDLNRAETTFDTDDLNDFAGTVGYDRFIGEYVTIGGSVTYYKEDAVGRDRAFTAPDGSPLIRDFRLRMIPVEFNVRVLPMGRDVPVVPYIGGGIGLYFWEYEEVGDFVVDRDTNPRIISASALSDGREFGFHIYGGLLVPLSEAVAFTGEIKHINLEPELNRETFRPDFDPIDLSAYIYSAGFTFFF